VPADQAALTIRDFCRIYRVGLTRCYELINEGKIVARKAGARRTLICAESARNWFATLEPFVPMSTAYGHIARRWRDRQQSAT
jgi:hypothetical protein